MLESAVKQYNWGYLDGWPNEVDLRTFWLFMLWRLQTHGSVDKLIDEMCNAFPDLLKQIPDDEYLSQRDQLGLLIELRFVVRFLQYWGFVTIEPKRYLDGAHTEKKVTLLPLLTQSITFLTFSEAP